MLDAVLKHFPVMVERRASDLILRSGHRPVIRTDGSIQFLEDEIFSEEDANALARHILTEDELADFHVRREKDTAFVVPGAGRFRCNMLRQRRQTAFVFRHVKEAVPSMTDLHLPVDVVRRMALMNRGLVLVTGIAGSGKSTTLASMIDYMNEQTHRHIVTIEDPIEFIFQDRKCAVTQREIGIDTEDCRTALKAAVRQTPDVILVGEMRDKETVLAALMAAETGHLVLSTLHTVNAVQTVERIISFFPPHQHDTIRMQLSLVLEGVVSQRLITRRANAGRVPAVEVMIGTPTVKEMILDGRTRELHQAIEEGHQYYGSQSFNQCLVALVRQGTIDFDDAMSAADNPDELKLVLRGITKGVNRIEHAYGT
ncbi:MAG: PilT/PilU family type 4a pilus ATPase [Planctomycetota bacterium]|nr:PilT/PilU family type 4a pilus ATPase [Planctomycetota bacterium]